MSCPPPLMVMFMKAMHDNIGEEGKPLVADFEPRWKKSTPRTRIGNINGANKFYGGINAPNSSSMELKTLIDLWLHRKEEAIDSAATFPMEKLKDCYAGLSSLKWDKLKIIRYWSMLLVAFVVCARASCLTKYMPKMADIRLPQAHNWDNDGIPKFIELGLRDWKWRHDTKRGQRYGIRLHRNYVDPRFCPVLFLMLWLAYGEPGADGGIWGDVTEAKYQTSMMKILAFIKTEDTADTASVNLRPHSIRAVGAQWAGRCGDTGLGAKNAGRWISVEMVAKYCGEGAEYASEFADAPDQDPIWSMWPWKPVTTGAASRALDSPL